MYKPKPPRRLVRTTPFSCTRVHDRKAWLLGSARKEGSVTLCTAMAPTEAGPLLKEFEKKYDIKTELWLSFFLNTTPRLAGTNATCRPTRAVANV